MKLTPKQIEYMESYSNLAYNIAGFVVYIIHRDVLVALAFQALGIGSFIFHYNKTRPIYLFDWWCMAFINTVLAGYHYDSELAWALLMLFHVFYGYVLIGRFSVYVEVALSSTIALAAIVYNTSPSNSCVVVLMFLTAIWIRSKDKDPKQAVFHDSIYHSAWHLLTAIGYYIAFYPLIN